MPHPSRYCDDDTPDLTPDPEDYTTIYCGCDGGCSVCNYEGEVVVLINERKVNLKTQ